LAVHVRIAEGDEEIEACFDIRRVVFIEEQSVPKDLEMDELDAVCTHYLAFADDDTALSAALGTARLWISPEGEAKAQRVAVLRERRVGGVGRAIMDALEADARGRGHTRVILGAQLSALGFYEKLGYRAYGPEFDDAGIPHRMMEKPL
jgi:predicted GNAT family N-acyltransferase